MSFRSGHGHSTEEKMSLNDDKIRKCPSRNYRDRCGKSALVNVFLPRLTQPAYGMNADRSLSPPGNDDFTSINCPERTLPAISRRIVNQNEKEYRIQAVIHLR